MTELASTMRLLMSLCRYVTAEAWLLLMTSTTMGLVEKAVDAWCCFSRYDRALLTVIGTVGGSSHSRKAVGASMGPADSGCSYHAGLFNPGQSNESCSVMPACILGLVESGVTALQHLAQLEQSPERVQI